MTNRERTSRPPPPEPRCSTNPLSGTSYNLLLHLQQKVVGRASQAGLAIGHGLSAILSPQALPAVALLLAFVAPQTGLSAGTLVFNEIMYHPATNEPALEWVELYNQHAVDLDISGWRITGGIEFVFPDGTIMPGRGYLVVALNPAAWAAQYPAASAALGPFSGRLSNGGETLELRSNSDRVMDQVTYGVDNDWPVAPDGGGVSLAKANPNAASGNPANWRASAQVGGTPGAANFPAGETLIPQPRLLTITNQWRFHDLGMDLGTAWRAPDYDDSAWSNGPALLFIEESSLPAPKTTPLAPGRVTYYFRTRFGFAGDPSAVLLSLHPIVDDGAIFYLNGAEILRVNMPAGPVGYTTLATAAVDNAAFSGPFTMPASHLVSGENVLAVEVHQAAGSATNPPAGLILSEIGGALFATNLARAPGSSAFGKDEIGGGAYPIHKIPNVRDGVYGNNNSWIGNSLNSFIGISFGATPQSIGRAAWGRDNTATYTDRSAGLYKLEFTTVPNPDAATPDAAWTLIGSITYPANGTTGALNSWSLRHVWSFPPVTATGLRLTVPGNSFADGACVDELEVAAYAPAPVRWVGSGGTMGAGNFATNAGATAFAKDVIPGYPAHAIPHLNDGIYGNANSWIGNSDASFAGIAFGAARTVSRVAFGRDNNGAYVDRVAGAYLLQYTTVASPGASTPNSAWTTIGPVYLDGSASNALRHVHEFAPVVATGLRLWVPGHNFDTRGCIDELEVYGPEADDVVFGAELAASLLVPPPGGVAFNEIASATNANFFIELINRGDAPIALAGCVLQRRGTTDGEFIFPTNQTLAPGGCLALAPAQLGFTPLDGDKLFLLPPSRLSVLDAVVVKNTLRGRAPDGTGRWMFPAGPTPGASNRFEFHHDVVFNEIMYHHRPLDAVPAVVSTNVLVALDAAWRYHDGGVDLGEAWRAPGYDDAAWSHGPAALHFDDAALAVPLRTPLAPGRTTYYFRHTFHWAGGATNLALRALVDDGAVFYLNGAEVHRFNMPAGPVAYGTFATMPVGNSGLGLVTMLSVTNLVVGPNVLAVEVHQAGSYSIPPLNTNNLTNAGVSLSPAGGCSLVWNGNNGEFSDPGALPLAPENLALASRGTVAFGSSQLDYGGIHLIRHVNDGIYGNSHSWIADFNAESAAWIGLRFTGQVAITSIAWGRDNGYDAECCGGAPAQDRWRGAYIVQVTTVAWPDATTPETGNAATGWETLGTVAYWSVQAGFTPWLRHRFDVRRGGVAVAATGLRIKVSSSELCLDEIEVNPPLVDIGHADVAFAAELQGLVTNSPAVPFRNSTENWVELFNRGTNVADLTGWRLDEGIDFHFAPGTIIPPGGFLVVAQDPALMQSLHPGAAVVGPFTNRLSHRSDYLALKDANNNLADEVRYFDGGRWPGEADGHGSSLELRDPFADNSKPEAWAASDESSATGWSNYVYRGVAQAESAPAPTNWNEFVLGLLDEGEVLLDDVHVRDVTGGGAIELIQNSDFEGGLAKWRIIGNHHGEVVTDPANGRNKALRLRATGPTDDVHNHAETTLAGNTAITNGREYEISFRARHLSGSKRLLTRLYFNRLPRVTVLAPAAVNGTPGRVNSRYATNIGPTFESLGHSPVVPDVGQAVTVSGCASDPDGVASATLWYSVNGGAWQSAPMSNHASRITHYLSASVPGQPAASLVQFYVDAVDGFGAHATFPAGGTNSRALYKVQDSAANLALAHNFRILLTAADVDFLFQPTNLMGNERVGGTVIYDEADVYYEVGIRLKGSIHGRPLAECVGFDLAFPPHQLFRGTIERVDLDRSGGWRFGRRFGQDEILVKHLVNRAGGVSCTYDDLFRLLGPRDDLTGPALASLDRFGPDHLAEEFQNGDEGLLYEYDAIYIPLTTTDGNPESPKLPNPYGHPPGINTDIRNLGADPEQYRWHFRVKNHRDRDDFGPLIPFAQSFELAGADLDARAQQLMDEDEWLRCFALMSLCGIGDAYTWGNNHNVLLYVRPKDGKMLAFPYDWDFAFIQPPTAPLYGDQNLRKIIERPANLRRYHAHLVNLIQTCANSAYLARWADHYDNFCPGQDFTSVAGWMGERTAYVLGRLPTAVPFAITSQGGTNFATGQAWLTLEGTAPVQVNSIQVNGVAYEPVWTTLTNWAITLPLAAGANALALQGLSLSGNVVSNAGDTIIVTNTGASAFLPVVINEWMADNKGPGGLPDSADGLFQDWFELFNPNTNAVNLSGLFLTDDLGLPTKWQIPPEVFISPRGYLLVWADNNTNQNPLAGGTDVDLHASFQLNNGGEAIGLFALDGVTPISVVTFGGQIENVSQGRYPDGDTNAVWFMTNWTPRAANTLAGLGEVRIMEIGLSGETLALTWNAVPGRAYQVEFTDDLAVPVWTNLGNPIRAAGATAGASEALAPGTTNRFYRVVLLP